MSSNGVFNHVYTFLSMIFTFYGCQSISSHAVDLFLVEYPSPSTRRDNIVFKCTCICECNFAYIYFFPHKSSWTGAKSINYHFLFKLHMGKQSVYLALHTLYSQPLKISIEQSSCGQQRADLGPVGPRWAQCWPHEHCYQGSVYKTQSVIQILESNAGVHFFACKNMSRLMHGRWPLLN